MLKKMLAAACVLLQLAACGQKNHVEQSKTFSKMNESQANPNHDAAHTSIATFGAGCFWCTEAQFQQLKGVTKVVSGYMGGTVKNPTYKEVCTGNTGHAEVTQVTFDPSVVSYDELLAAFFVSHDPTQLNRQGNDYGTQYRSAIFYHNEEQKEKAMHYIKALNDEHAYPSPIVTEVTAEEPFYPAEDYHQDYYNQNGSQPYCQMVIQPKLEKFKKVFKDKLK
ncbi:peptide-methionine (S)-S-oxide reductase MsrA [Rurimicrobium arvi]|uniref:Peptide methionine sulfoxide reductase MsrA n=1 Tax=Rurimicrobium arvi TaxID=2049916 RepID=A0ABP8MU93_9BACT